MHSTANGIYWVCYLLCPIHTALLEKVPSPQLREYCDPHTALLELIEKRWEMPLRQQWISWLTRNLLHDRDQRDPLGQVEVSCHDRGIQAAIVWLVSAGIVSALQAEMTKKGRWGFHFCEVWLPFPARSSMRVSGPLPWASLSGICSLPPKQP